MARKPAVLDCSLLVRKGNGKPVSFQSDWGHLDADKVADNVIAHCPRSKMRNHNLKNVRVRVDQAVYRKVKLFSAHTDLSLSEIIHAALEEYLNRHTDGRFGVKCSCLHNAGNLNN